MSSAHAVQCSPQLGTVPQPLSRVNITGMVRAASSVIVKQIEDDKSGLRLI